MLAVIVYLGGFSGGYLMRILHEKIRAEDQKPPATQADDKGGT